MRGIGLHTLLAACCLPLVAATVSAAPNEVETALAAALQQGVVSCSEARLDSARLAAYYDATAPAPFWVGLAGPNGRAGLLRKALQEAEREGLAPARYRLAEVEAHWPGRTPHARVCLELLLTAAFDRYSRDLRYGRVGAQEADPSWHLHSSPFDAVAILRSAKTDREVARLLRDLPPRHIVYVRLRAALVRYRMIAAQGGWAELPRGPKLEEGDKHEQVAMLRARLRLEGDLPWHAASFGARFDAALAEALRSFQQRHGLHPDGVVGARTRAALNVPAAERAAQLRRAMERLRWLPRDLGAHYILANTAGFELAVIEDGKTVLAMRTINGTPDQATPSFSATLKSMIINPFWYVPERIARDRLWPREQQRPGYLAARGFRIFDTRGGRWQELDPARLDWARINGDKSGVRLRQEPGPINLMGRLSFVFPNPHDVFLHDTPQRALFERDARTFSEGCVRIEKAMDLALHTLRRAPEWTQAGIQSEIDALHHRTVPLPEPIPVYVLYLPSWVDDDDRVHFREDPYGREAVLAEYFPAK